MGIVTKSVNWMITAIVRTVSLNGKTRRKGILGGCGENKRNRLMRNCIGDRSVTCPYIQDTSSHDAELYHRDKRIAALEQKLAVAREALELAKTSIGMLPVGKHSVDATMFLTAALEKINL